MATRGIDQQQQLHDRLRRRIRRLHDEDIRSADVFIDANEDLAIGEASQRDLAQLAAEVSPDLFGEWPILRAREELEALHGYGESVHVPKPGSLRERRNGVKADLTATCANDVRKWIAEPLRKSQRS